MERPVQEEEEQRDEGSGGGRGSEVSPKGRRLDNRGGNQVLRRQFVHNCAAHIAAPYRELNRRFTCVRPFACGIARPTLILPSPKYDILISHSLFDPPFP